jgi:hypothetical protein
MSFSSSQIQMSPTVSRLCVSVRTQDEPPILPAKDADLNALLRKALPQQSAELR